MKVPFKTLKFGPYQVSVKRLRKEDRDENWGLYWPGKHQMDVQAEYPTKERAIETVLHEAVHIILEERNVDLGRKEEEAVTQLAKGLVAFFRDNKEFTSWFFRCLRSR